MHELGDGDCAFWKELKMRRLTVIALTLSLIAPLTLFAQKPEKPGKPQKVEKAEKPDKAKGKPQDSHVTVVFSGTQREAAQQYFVQAHGRGNCPPGLAKKQNGCLPPGQAKKRYAVGHPLPKGIVLVDLPPELNVRIGPAPAGYRYGILDGDLIKLAIGTLLVVDAIHGLVN
jgi:hypothetical protein